MAATDVVQTDASGLGRIARAEAYLEPVLYMAARDAAKTSGKPLSNWLRGLVVKELRETGRLTEELLLELARAG